MKRIKLWLEYVGIVLVLLVALIALFWIIITTEKPMTCARTCISCKHYGLHTVKVSGKFYLVTCNSCGKEYKVKWTRHARCVPRRANGVRSQVVRSKFLWGDVKPSHDDDEQEEVIVSHGVSACNLGQLCYRRRMARRRSHKPEIVGSIPTCST